MEADIVLDLAALFEKHCDEFLKFDRVISKRSRRPDLHAFLLLDELSTDEEDTFDIDMVSCARHDEIALSPSPEHVANVATEDQIVDLIRCGVQYSRSRSCFWMFT